MEIWLTGHLHESPVRSTLAAGNHHLRAALERFEQRLPRDADPLDRVAVRERRQYVRDGDRTCGEQERQGSFSHCTKTVPVNSHNDFSRPLVEKGVV